jgi:hypothetical protein
MSAAEGVAESSDWIDTKWLKEECPDGVCSICLGIMIKPVVGCQEGHSFCRTCCRSLVNKKQTCPLCRNTLLTDPVPNLVADNLIGKVNTRCKNGRDDSAVVCWTKGEVTPAEWMTNEDLERCGVPLSSAGIDVDCCSWSGKVSELLGHLQTICPFEQVSCPNEGCSERLLRKHLAEHNAKCGFCKVACQHCGNKMERRFVAAHETDCLWREDPCPNPGCTHKAKHCNMNLHRAKCGKEKVLCPIDGCTARMSRESLDKHVSAVHERESPAALLSDALAKIAALERSMISEHRFLTLQAGVASNPHPLATWVFNWSADDGWRPGEYPSEKHSFSFMVSGHCKLACGKGGKSHYIGFSLDTQASYKVHSTFFVLDRDDQILFKIRELGTSNEAFQVTEDASGHCGEFFTPTDAVKEKSTRFDGSVRLRADVRVFPMFGFRASPAAAEASAPNLGSGSGSQAASSVTSRGAAPAFGATTFSFGGASFRAPSAAQPAAAPRRR